MNLNCVSINSGCLDVWIMQLKEITLFTMFYIFSEISGNSSNVQHYAAAAARKPDTQPSAPHHTDNLKTKAPNTTGSDHLYNNLELLMMDIMVPETCWANNKICNKYHLLHLVGILFPHINDDARSESLQKCRNMLAAKTL